MDDQPVNTVNGIMLCQLPNM